MAVTTVGSALNCVGIETANSVTSAASESLAVPVKARHCIIAVQSVAARWTADGTTPVTGAAGTGVGIPAVAGTSISFMDANIDYYSVMRAFKIVGNGGTTIIDCVYFD